MPIGPSYDMTGSIKKVKQENPDLPDTSIEPAGWIGKMLMGRAEAITNPFTGNIAYNPDAMGALGQNQGENILAHEMQHARQLQSMNYLQRLMGIGKTMMGMDDNYWERPRELEAFQAERDRTLSQQLPGMLDPVTGRGDIELPKMRRRR